MPFDYNSFIQGVWTGMRLPRVPGDRQPPVPSGKYILTESGERIITETPYTSDCTIYQTGIDYLTYVFNPESPYRREEVYLNLVRTHASTTVHEVDKGYYFIADNLNANYYVLVIFGEPDLLNVAGSTLQRIGFDAELKFVSREGTEFVEIASGGANFSDGHRVVWASFNIQNKEEFIYRIPENVVCWNGTQDELEDFVMSLNPAYLITE